MDIRYDGVYITIWGEQHIRQFIPLILRNKYTNLFVDATRNRYRTVCKELEDVGYPMSRFNVLPYNRSLAATQKWAGSTVVFPMPINYLGIYRNKRPILNKGPSSGGARIITMDEGAYTYLWRPYMEENAKPYTHIYLARSKIEAQYINKVSGGSVEVVEAGDMELDHNGYIPPVEKKTGKWGIFTALTPFEGRDKIVMPILSQALDELSEYLRCYNIHEIVHKAHPLESRGNTNRKINHYCSQHRLKYTGVSKDVFLGGILHDLSGAIVIGSFSTHQYLRKRGIRSFYYGVGLSDNRGLSVVDSEHTFFKESGYPGCTLSGGDNKFDDWACDTFLLDGKVLDRVSQYFD